MIGIIGYQDDVIGFGLTGIVNKIELTKNTTQTETKKAILQMSQKVNVIIINESLIKNLKQEKEFKKILFIEIPEDKQKTNLDEIEKLIKDTLGINF